MKMKPSYCHVIAVFGVLGLWILSFPALAVSEKQETHREIMKTYVQFFIETKNESDALRRIEKHLSRYPGDHEALALRGIVQLRFSQARAALQSFEEAEQSSTQTLDRSQYQIYQAYTAAVLGDYTLAREILIKLRDNPAYRSTLQTLIDGIQSSELPRLSEMKLREESQAPSNKSLILSLGGGYDSNVLLLSNTLLETLSQADTHSAYYRADLMGSVSKDAAESRSSLFGRVAYTGYTMKNARRFGSANVMSGMSWMQKHTDFVHSGFSNNLSMGVINQNAYELFSVVNTFRFDTRLNWTDKIYTEIQLPLSYQLFNYDENTDAANLRSGVSYGVRLVQFIPYERHRFTARSRFTQTMAEGDNFNSRSFSQSFGWSSLLSPQWRASFGLRFQYTDYPHNDENRADQQLIPNFNLSYVVNSKIQIRSGYSFIFNRSNVDQSEYVKHNASLTLSYSLF